MKIIGRLLKKTVEISHKRSLIKGHGFEHQINSLKFLLEYAKKTNFGKNHQFSDLLLQEDIVKSFQKEVPIVDYDEFFRTWLHRTIDGVHDHTWPGKISYFALSSGTTGSPSKRIPVSKELIKSFQRTSIRQASTLHELNLPPEVYQKTILVIGGSPKLEKVQNHIEGDLSGILKKHTSWIVLPFTQPNNKIAEIKDWNKKIEKLVQNASKWDVAIMTGIPSWCIMLIERIIERYQLNNIHELWPNFSVYVHGGVFIQPYLNRLNRSFGKKVHLLDTYLASEGYFAYQDNTEDSSMKLLLDNQIFFEFVPFNDEYFTPEGTIRNNYKALTVDEVEKEVDYALLISTDAGLWRYLIGDLVQFTDTEKRKIKITGRIKQYLSLVGEHLSLDNINHALSSVCKEMKIEINEFCITQDILNQRHVWVFGVHQTEDTQLNYKEFLDKLDNELCVLNDDYRSVRKYSLNAPKMLAISNHYFYQFMDRMGKLGSQNKFPRVMNQHQASEWFRFLNENGIVLS
ncbi:MAG: GH3 auxin-responsive promoter family protein [Flavobacteriia bacterium]|nr:GH3 auxin-responsive promoter family protein [Flavobacteriia bacterium]